MPDGGSSEDDGVGDSELAAQIAATQREVEELEQRLDDLRRQALARGTRDLTERADEAVKQVTEEESGMRRRRQS